MDIKNDAHASGFLTISVKVSGRLSSMEYRDNEQLVEWLVEKIRDYEYQEIRLLEDNLELSDFDYVDYENDY